MWHIKRTIYDNDRNTCRDMSLERPCAGNITRVTVQVKSKGIFPGLFFCFKMIKFLLKQSEIRVWEISNLIAQSD